LAFAAKGKAGDAAAEYAKFAELEKNEKVVAMDNPYFPGTKILAIANKVLAGKVAWAQGKHIEAIQQLRDGTKLQDAMPYMEPPYWYYPVRQTLGAALVQAGRAKEAETIFEQALENTPKNGWALYGLMESQKAQGKQDEAQATQKRLQKAWIGDLSQLHLGRL